MDAKEFNIEAVSSSIGINKNRDDRDTITDSSKNENSSISINGALLNSGRHTRPYINSFADGAKKILSPQLSERNLAISSSIDEIDSRC